MRIPNVEPRQLGLQTRRIAGPKWVALEQQEYPMTELYSNPSDLSDFPAKYGTVILEYSLNYAEGIEGKRVVIANALKALKPGGRVVSVARACDSGIELAERMVKMGTPPDDLGSSNLTNKEIGILRPSQAVFLSSHETLRLVKDFNNPDKAAAGNQQRVRSFVARVRRSPIAVRFEEEVQEGDINLRGPLPDGFVTKVIDVGMIWQA